MKRYIISSIVALGGAIALNAQSAYDAESMVNTDLNGTARYVGMGGAMGALGADLSTMGSNPAGTGLMRSSDMSISFGGVFTGNSGVLNKDAGRASLDQAGVLFALGGDGGSVRNINFGVNYQKRRNFLSNLDTWLNLNGGSQTFQLAEMADAAYQNGMNYGYLVDAVIPYADNCRKEPKDKPTKWVSDYHQGIILDNYNSTVDYDNDKVSTNDYLNRFNAYKDGKLETYGFFGVGAAESNYRRATYGNNAQVDINVSTNIEDKVFLGLSVGVYTMSYDRQTAYYEKGTDDKTYQIDNWYHNSADGIDVKFGAIFRPIDYSPFRFGVHVHTPIWYAFRDYNTLYVDALDFRRESDVFNYRFRTPWKFGVSIGHTFDNILALGIDYEFQDYSTSKYYTNHGDDINLTGSNENIKANLRASHTLKVGLEFKPSQEFAIRLGYNLVTSPFKNNAYNYLDYSSTFSETDYTNWGATNRLTFGLGYRFKGGYFDLAYQLQLQKGKFYAYDYDGVVYRDVGGPANLSIAPTEITNNRSHIMATIGFKF